MNLKKKETLIAYLQEEDEDKVQQLFADACQQRQMQFGNRIFLYGFVYFSTWCRNNCNFCLYRQNNDIERYRKSEDEVLAIASQLTASGVHLLDLTMGEDAVYHEENFATVQRIVQRIKKELDMPVMISPGVINRDLITAFADLGTEWYALYQETHNRELFGKLRWQQDYDERMACKQQAKQQGMLIEEGILVGVGERLEDIADSLLEMGQIGASQVRVMSFVPQQGSPMAHRSSPQRLLELKVIALLRLLYPQALIPASLDVDGISGLEDRIRAGANVVTSIIPPKSGLMGVAQSVKDVDEGGRTVEEVKEILTRIGLTAATTVEYQDYLQQLFARP